MIEIKGSKKLLLKTIKRAGILVLKSYGRVKSIRAKDHESYVTEVDIASEKLIISAIRKKFPKHDIVSEESAATKNNSDFKWYIDPIDGTHNFIRGFPLFGVSIGLEYRGKMALGAMNMPLLGEIYFAEKGKGAFLNGKRISVSNKNKMKEAFIVSDLMLRYGPEKKLEALKRMRGKIHDMRAIGCAVAGYAFVAKGVADAYYTLETFPWDAAAGTLIVQEAGGKVTGLKGEKFDISSGKYLASNGRLHEGMLGFFR
ncbi:inositol monophosphatase [Candidatus Woesearchaeota archaeon]|nr:inositol monophosphatase [Candidatus Woesearchaeota archaeon]